MPDKLELQLASLDKRVNAVEKLVQKAPAADPTMVVLIKRVDTLEKRIDVMGKSVEQLKAIVAQIGKSLEGKKDQASMEQLAQKQAEKETRKIIDEMKLQVKDAQLDARMKVIETKLEMTMKAALSAGPR